MKTLKNILKIKTFVVLISMMTLTALYAGVFASSPTAFKDVPASYWGYKNIQRAYTDGVVSGTDYNEKTGERNFSPESKLTMAQFTTILTRAFYADELAASTAGNEPDAKWYAATQDVCEKRGLTKGFSFYNAEVESSRYQMATIIYNILVDKGVTLPTEAELTAAQAKIGDWDRISEERYRKPIATVVAMGIITGKDSSGSFVGADYVTRAEAATIYCRLADVINAGGSVQKPEQPVEKPEEPVVKPEPKPETPVKKPVTGNSGAVGTLSDTPITLSLSTHKPVVDYWSKASADVQAITDKDMFNATVQTMKDKDTEVFEEQGNIVKNNINYNYACWDYSKVDANVRKNISGALTGLSGYGSYGFARSLSNSDNTNLAVITYSLNNGHKAKLDQVFAPIFAQFRSGMSDKEKAEIMLKAITDRFEYGSGTFDWTNENRIGDCDNFAGVVKTIFGAAGIPNCYESGKVYNGSHMWNLAYLDGKWYVVDATAAEFGYDGVMTFEEHKNIYKYSFDYEDTARNKVIFAIVEAVYNQ